MCSRRASSDADEPVMNRLKRQLNRLRGDGLRATLARGSGWAFLISLLGFGLMYVLRVALVKWMGRSEYGEYAFALSWATVLMLVASVGLPLAALRYMPQYLAAGDAPRLRGLLRFGQALTLLGGGAVAAVGTLAITRIDTGRYSAPTLILAMWLVPLLSLAMFQREAIRSLRKIVASQAPSQVVQPLLVLAIMGVAAMAARRDSTFAMGATMVAAGAVLAVQWVLLRRHLPRLRDGGPRTTTDLRGWMGVALPLLFVQESTILLGQTDLLLVGVLLTPADVAVYDAAAKTAIAAIILQRAVKTMATPMVAQLHFEGRHEQLRRLVATSTKWMFWSTLATGLAIVVVGPLVLRGWGKNFTAGALPLAILVLGQVIAASVGPAGQMLNLLDQHRRSVVAYATSAAVAVALGFLLIPRLGLEGAALATTASLVLRNVWAYWLVRRHLGLGPFAFGRGASGTAAPTPVLRLGEGPGGATGDLGPAPSPSLRTGV